MTAVSRHLMLPPPGATPGRAVAPALEEQQVRPLLPARRIEGGHPEQRQAYDAEQRQGERRIGDRRLADRQVAQARIGDGRGRDTAAEPASGRLIAFSRLSTMPFMVQVLGQETAGRPAAAGPQTSLSGHRDAALLGSDIYRKAGGEPEFLPETATFVRLAV